MNLTPVEQKLGKSESMIDGVVLFGVIVALIFSPGWGTLALHPTESQTSDSEIFGLHFKKAFCQISPSLGHHDHLH